MDMLKKLNWKWADHVARRMNEVLKRYLREYKKVLEWSRGRCVDDIRKNVWDEMEACWSL